MLEQKAFFKKYPVERAFKDSELEWSVLEKIYDDYKNKDATIKSICTEMEKYLVKHCKAPFHSIRCRAKDAEHLIEKIIRKRGIEHNKKYKNINESNYCEIVRDLIGVRILIFYKEDWEKVFDNLVDIFPEDDTLKIGMKEEPVAYTRYGDRDIFKDKIRTEHSNRGYRSQHYIVRFEGFYCEIQVRTLAEEVYGEFDHKVKYPYRDQNKFLIRYTNTLSQLLDSVDELISTCFQMEEKGWENNSLYFKEDSYIDWKNISQKTKKQKTDYPSNIHQEKSKEKIDLKTYASNILLRKE